MKLDAFRLEDVRCFAGPQEVRVRPLTFLVGENSTGKSTVLGCMQAVADYMDDVGSEIDFNRHPYEMGSYREIARRSRPLIQSFKLGVVSRDANGRDAARYTVELREREGGARAAVKQVTWQLRDLRIVLRPRRGASRLGRNRIRVTANEDSSSFLLEVEQPWFDRIQAKPWMWWHWVRQENKLMPDVDALQAAIKKHLGNTRRLRFNFSPASSIAPIRSKPQRTYNPFLDAPDPEGSGVPAELASVARKGGKSWDRLKGQLEQFGRDAGLFSELAVRQLGKSSSDPFQLQVKARGPKANIKDVGYGVSQILPILVRLAHRTEHTATALIQQPEVHLHPRGQAALSSILISLLGPRRSRGSPSRFVIETHSDYMIDRARIAIRRGEIRADDVSLVYLEPEYRGGVAVHNIRFDETGNMTHVPSGYRNFFLKESDDLLGFAE